MMLGRIKNSIKSRLYAGDVERMIGKNKIPDQVISLKRLKDLGFRPKLIFDVGAYHGDFTQTCLNIWPDAGVHAFEALPDKIRMLKNKFEGKRVTITEGIIGETEQDNMGYYADETSSSVLESQEFTPKKKLQQKMITLDGYVGKQQLAVPNLLKIDTQGYEYPILKGFEKHLSAVDVILLELNFIEIYNGVKLAHEIIAFLDLQGFVIYDICEIHRRPLDLALFQIDFIFVKKEDAIRKDKRWDIK